MPLAAIGLLGTIAGTSLSIAGNAKSQSAINAARSKEVQQQKLLQQQSSALFNDSLKKSTPATAQQQMTAGQNARTNAWTNLQDASTPIASALPATGTGTATSKSATRTGSAANAWNTLTATSAAKEGGYGDWENDQAIKNADTAQRLGVINNFSQGDANLLPMEVQVASQKGDALSGWGSIVSMLGSAAGLAGASGAFGAAKAATAVPSAASRAASMGLFPDEAATESILATPAVDENVWNKLYGNAA